MTASVSKTYIVGVGSDGVSGLTARAREIITSADLILGSEHALELVPEVKAERFRIGVELQETVRALESNFGRKRMVVVASGDPLFYGVYRIGLDFVRIHIATVEQTQAPGTSGADPP